MIQSIGWPKMFNLNSTVVKEDHDATVQNLKLLLHSEKLELLGDPFYGVNFRKTLFEQNGSIIRDILIDDIYSQIASFMPQLTVKRQDITIEQEGTTLYCNIYAMNNISYTTDMYSIVLFKEDNQW